MFAYCLNNPVSGVDPDGELTKRQIHDRVLAEIVRLMAAGGRTLSMNNTTIYYNGSNYFGGWGFCDLYDFFTGEVWELKRKTCSKEKAENQLQKYVKGRLKYKKHQELSIGGNLFEGKYTFTITDGSTKYHITFWQGENGILWYDYYTEKSKNHPALGAAALIGLTACITGAGGGGGSSAMPQEKVNPLVTRYDWAA